jgi:hypothetical protein
MRLKVITTTSDLSKCRQLEYSLKYWGYDYFIIQHEWTGFLDKLRHTYYYLKSLEGYTHFLYSDAWDTFALKGPESIPEIEGLLISAERACYPHTEKAVLYPDNTSPFKYVNGGGFMGEISAFLKIYEGNPPKDEMNDQVWLTDIFLKYLGTGEISLDYGCQVFQTVAFCPEDNFKGAYNKVTDSFPIFWHGNGHTSIDWVYKLLQNNMETLQQVVAFWEDKKEVHRTINETFTEKVNADPKLKAYRDWIEEKIFGFGERSFLWMWKLIMQELPANALFLEIGVFRGQILGLIRMLAPKADITGITPLDSTGGHWDSNYEADIKLLHKTFKLKQPKIIKGLSMDAIEEAGKQLYDVIYIDGGHSYDVARSDIWHYSSFVKVGGFLVIDDCAHKYDLPEGYFKGIEDVSRATDELLPNEYYTELFNVVHNRVFKRVK